MRAAITPATTPVTTAIGRAMGCRVQVAVAAPFGRAPDLVATAFRRLEHLERCWSRFLPDSDISRLNQAGGRPITVDPSTIVLIREMAAGMRSTAGSFDPTLLGSVVGLGIATAWCARGGAAGSAADRLAWIDETTIDPDGPQARIPSGLHLDAGAIGKGLAADLVATELIAAGATGARILVGGDGRVVMPSTIDVRDPSWSQVIDRIAAADCGIATSGVGAPPTGRGRLGAPVLDRRRLRPLERPSRSGLVQVTVAAESAAAAEVLATAILVDGDDGRPDLNHSGVGVLTIRADGRLVANAPWAALRCAGDRRWPAR